MTMAIIYCRFSPRPNAAECDSCEKQEERIRAYCSRRGYEIKGKPFKDKNISGGTINRPGLLAAIETLSPGDLLVADTTDRLARDTFVSLTIQHDVNKKGAAIEYANGTPPANTAIGELINTVFAAIDHYQRRVIRERTRAGLAKKKADGKYLGKCPYGYKRECKGGTLVEDEEEQKIIEEICAYNLTSAQIVHILNNNNSKCRGKPWNTRTVRRIIDRVIKKRGNNVQTS